MYEPTPPGHRVGPALVALLVALAATAGTFGYLVTRRVVNPQAAGGATSSPTRGTSTSPRAGSTRPPDADNTCPAVTAAAVRAAGLNGDLRLLLYIRTHTDGAVDSEVWICWNADDRLIYQGHLMSGGLDSADNGVNTLLIAEGIKGRVEREGAGFKATNPVGAKITEYRVSKDRLEIRNIPGGREVHPVVESHP